MRILIVRHAEPDYEHDSLTPVGKKEAAALAEWLKNEPIDYAYLSPLGRARETADYTLKLKGMTGEILPWLREFDAHFTHPETGKPSIIWDLRPSFYQNDPRWWEAERWLDIDCIKNSPVPEAYRAVCASLDELLARHGYVWTPTHYRVEKSNKDTVAFFCHFGLESMLLSHIMHVSPFQLSHYFCALPSSVTTLVSEEREEGLSHFRCLSYGSTQHLYKVGQEPSFAARFCETFDSPERH